MSRRLWQRVGRVKIYRDTDLNEYEVLDERQREGEGYFTSDKQDAVDTANAILLGKYEKNAGQKKMPQAFNYNDAAEVYDNTPRGNLGGNTTIRRDGNDYVIRLHKTDIIRYHPDDSITLNSGGYHTATTKGRINAFLSPKISISQKNNEWFAHTSVFRTTFYDGIRIYPTGEPFGHRRGDDYDETEENPRRYDRAHPGYKGADIRFHDDFAHRGYLVKYNAIHETYYISKGGHHIGSAASAARAREIIDELTAE